jgi:peptidyl-tRNA hydrolase
VSDPVLAAIADPRGRSDPDDPARVLAMPVVLRIERADPPARTALLAAAASAALAVCLDPRAGTAEDGEPGPWRAPVLDWCSGRIRKVSRRARGAHWAAVGELEGVTVDVGGAQARALVPVAVGETPPQVRRLQISGTELEPDEPGGVPDGAPVLWLDAGLEMTVGKAAAQVGHATMLLAASLGAVELAVWRATGWACAVRDATPERFARELGRPGSVAVRDAGYTEVPAGSVTVVTRWRQG